MLRVQSDDAQRFSSSGDIDFFGEWLDLTIMEKALIERGTSEELAEHMGKQEDFVCRQRDGEFEIGSGAAGGCTTAELRCRAIQQEPWRQFQDPASRGSGPVWKKALAGR